MSEQKEIDGVDADDDEDMLDDDFQDENNNNDITAKNTSGAIHSPGCRSVVGLRLMIRWFLVHGCNIALINNLEFRDTKVCACFT
jgi:hypothetical protein